MFKCFKSLSILATAGLASVSFASSLSRDAINQKIEKALAPFNTDSTRTQFVFTQLESNETDVTKASVQGYFAKFGPENYFAFDLDELSYDLKDGINPEVISQGRLSFDMVKAVGQETINEFGPMFGYLAEDFVKEMTSEYGDAATANGEVSNIEMDSNGNLVAADLSLTVEIDLTQLPESVSQESVPVKELNILIKANITGLDYDVDAILNPDYVGEGGEFSTIKEVFEKFLADDEELWNGIDQSLVWMDYIVEFLVNKSADDQL